MSNLIHIDKDYKQWITSLSKRFRKGQIKASIGVNKEMLHFYWELGHDIVTLNAEQRWGSAFMHTLSQDLRREIPDATGLTQSNLYYIKKFYLLYSQSATIFPQVVGKSHSVDSQSPDTDFPALLSAVPWGHHRYIIDKCKGDVNKALFYVHQTVENGWSRAVLLNWIDTDLYERQGKAITNFSTTLPDETSDLVQEITKDPYDFAFAGITGKYNERKLKDALLQNITDFLIELGTGFAYVGKEYRLQIGETENFIDLLFYNLKLRCYVAIEVKIDKFDARDIGQLGTYVTAVNHILRDQQNDNPTIGLLICKSKDNTLAQYALEGYNLPLGISEYELQKIYPAKIEGLMRTIKDIEDEISDNHKP